MSKGATIQFWRGVEADIPILADGEPGWCLDTFTLFVGVAGTNHQVGGGVSIGSAVGGGPTAGSVLFVDASGNLAEDASTFFYDENGSIGGTARVLYVGGSSSGRITLGSIEITGTTGGFPVLTIGGNTTLLGNLTASAGSIFCSDFSAHSGVLTASSSGSEPFTIIAAVGQTGDLSQWKNSANAIQSRINGDGYIMTRKVAVPADGDLNNSELAFWLDDTPAATKAMFKAKDSAGTVRTGSVNLT